ncbi:MAG: outer membrane beta-barrel protein [Limisphaerales bacterium]
MTGISTFAQAPSFGPIGRDYLSRSGPLPPFTTPEVSRYNLKWGDLTARFSASTQTEFNDNINLSQTSPQADLSIGPNLGVGFMWRISKANELHMDLDAGYLWYLNSPSLNSLNIAPNSIIEHTIYLEKVRINLHDNYGIQVDPTSLGELSGGTNSVVDYRRFNNVAGLTTSWEPYRNLSLSGGFNDTYDRSMTHDFTSLDQDAYAFNAGGNYTLSPRWAVGLNGNYIITRYVEKVQNGGTTYASGPSLTYKPTQHITVNLSAGYMVSTFDHTGTITDTSDFRGMSYEASIFHTLNSRTSHDLHFSRTAAPGVGSNFTELTDVQYELRKQIRRTITLHTTVAYEHLRASGLGAETADRYLFYLGTNYQFSRHWTAGLGYTLAWKNSDLADQSYSQNRLTLDFERQF